MNPVRHPAHVVTAASAVPRRRSRAAMGKVAASPLLRALLCKKWEL
jgi:hypothetical protein